MRCIRLVEAEIQIKPIPLNLCKVYNHLKPNQTNLSLKGGQYMSYFKAGVKGILFPINRLEALTDGVFAIVMTLLVLDIGITDIPQSSVQAEMPRKLLELWPQFFSYIMSFIILGMIWISHHRIFHYIKSSNPILMWLNVLFLMFVALVPFSTRLLGDYLWQQVPFVVYGINLFLIFITRLVLWNYASGESGLIDSGINPLVIKRLRLVIGVIPTIMFLAMIGVSFISIIAGYVILWLFFPYGFIAQRLTGSE
jgi:uncharacterized membrane protein